jgi:protein-tyrosine phosphatase
MSFQYPIAYLTLSLTCLGCASVGFWKQRYLPIAGILVWIGVSFLLLSIVYFLNIPKFLGKNSRGGRNPLAWIVFGPYLILCELSTMFQRSKSSLSEAFPGLYIGRRLSNREAEAMLATIKPKTIIDLAPELVETPSLRSIHYHSIPVLDAHAPTVEQLVEVTRQIRRGLDRGPVYVHCALGYGRSGTAAAAFLIAIEEALDVKNAVAQLKRVRPGIVLTSGQRETITQSITQLKRVVLLP